MKVLIVGTGKGSWTMRGEQLGAAIGARVTSEPTAADWVWADVAVLVKRAGRQFAGTARQYRVPVVWDALDFWRQPAENGLGEKAARQLLGAHLAEIRSALTIGATKRMAADAGGTYLPHHSWANLAPQPARERVEVVAYEGNPTYLGGWWQRLADACKRRGWTFVVNPPDIRVVDIFATFRDGNWDGHMCREWKSGVKVVNAIAAGRPIIGQSCAAITELCPPSTIVESPEALDAALDAWTPCAARTAAVDVCRQLAPEFTLSAVAQRYLGILQHVEASCAA